MTRDLLNILGREQQQRESHTDDDGDGSDDDTSRAYTILDGSIRPGQAWEHAHCMSLLEDGGDILDVLKKTANESLAVTMTTNTDGHDDSRTFRRFFGFLAARTLQNIHLAECLWKWKQQREEEEEINISRTLTMIDSSSTSTKSENGTLRRLDSLRSATFLERFALLIGKMQQTPQELLDMEQCNSGGDAMDSSATIQILDEMAAACRTRMQSSPSLSMREKLGAINAVLVEEYCLVGNEQNYYDYRNSILSHVVKSKKGIPLTLCIVYVCVCRRLGIPASVIGIPGHVVLGFEEEEEVEEAQGGNTEVISGQAVTVAPPRRAFLDVFRGGQVLSVVDCQEICASYGIQWDESFLDPLTTSRVVQRILNNLANCHVRILARAGPAAPPFHNDLFLQQRAITAIHQQPPMIAGPMIERLMQDLPFTLAPDLLATFGLYSGRN